MAIYALQDPGDVGHPVLCLAQGRDQVSFLLGELVVRHGWGSFLARSETHPVCQLTSPFSGGQLVALSLAILALSPAKYAVKCEVGKNQTDQLDRNKQLAKCLGVQVGEEVGEELAKAAGVNAIGEFLGPEVGLPLALITAAIESRPLYKAFKSGLTVGEVSDCVMQAYGR